MYSFRQHCFSGLKFIRKQDRHLLTLILNPRLTWKGFQHVGDEFSKWSFTFLRVTLGKYQIIKKVFLEAYNIICTLCCKVMHWMHILLWKFYSLSEHWVLLPGLEMEECVYKYWIWLKPSPTKCKNYDFLCLSLRIWSEFFFCDSSQSPFPILTRS